MVWILVGLDRVFQMKPDGPRFVFFVQQSSISTPLPAKEIQIFYLIFLFYFTFNSKR